MKHAGGMDRVADLLGGGRTIAYKTDLSHATGSVTSGLLLSQFWYWSNSRDVAERDGWFWKTMPEITEETGLTRTEQENARKKLVKLGILEEERRGAPAKLWFRLDKNALYDLLAEYLTNKNDGNPQTSLRETCKLDCGKPTSKSAGNEQSLLTKITAENTTQKTAADTDADQAPAAAVADEISLPADQGLTEELITNGVNRRDAKRLSAEQPEEARRQLSYLPFVTDFKSSKGAYLRSAIEQGFGPPKAYLDDMKRRDDARKTEETRKAREAQKMKKEAERQELITYLHSQIQQLKDQSPEMFADFEQTFEKKKEAQLRIFPHESSLRTRLEAQFSSDDKRAEAFLDYIAEKPCPLPQLQAWLLQNDLASAKEILTERL